ncbi:hypothetical protein [uncultured Desulfobacter sp.]|uniref:hypothetical protein n=1 Tax=uncultured Desulfobacter sp. TaxID=240139 RepID=UPI002AAA6FF1|nr:hypothetical protein [uncultured Desulfobacter sp.]
MDIIGIKTSGGADCVVIAAITSCTNTSKPFRLIGAGLMRYLEALGFHVAGGSGVPPVSVTSAL